MNALIAYDFPGNVRELENTMERAMALEGESEVSLENLPPAIKKLAAGDAPIERRKNFESSRLSAERKVWEDASIALERGSVNLEKIVGDLEKDYILKALEKTGGVKKKAAGLLGITFRSIRYRINKYDIHDAEGDIDE